jgi:hypothetical protein
VAKKKDKRKPRGICLNNAEHLKLCILAASKSKSVSSYLADLVDEEHGLLDEVELNAAMRDLRNKQKEYSGADSKKKKNER